MAQTQVKGTVISSEDGLPVVGASVIVAGTKTGTLTDVDGKFSLSVPNGTKLVISYLGMQQKTVSAWSPASSDYRDFFNTGVSFTNNIAVSQALDNGSFRVSYTNTDLKGYLPNSSQYKNTLNVTGNVTS